MKKRQLFIALLILLMTGFSFSQSVTVKDYTITFNGVDYDYINGTSTWSYTMSTVGSAKDLSHWVVELCQTHNVIESSESPWEVPTNGDPTTGVYGMKWDGGLATGQTRDYYFVLDGIYDVVSAKVAVKTGGKNKVGVGYLLGPDCDEMQNNASLGDKVWLDSNKDGIQDNNESGVKEVIVKLFDCDDNFIKSTETDDNGNYLFDNLTPGNYYVQFILPETYQFTTKNSGNDILVDSDADQNDGKTVCTELSPGENDMTWDAGIYKEEVPDTCVNDFSVIWTGETEYCEYEAKYIYVKANVSLTPSPSTAIIKTYSPAANGVTESYYTINADKKFTLTGYWPGITSDDSNVSITFSLEVFDCDTNKIGDTKTFTVSWDETVCPPPADNEPDIKIEKSVNNSSPENGETIEYSVVVTNLGPGTATNLVISDLLPSGVDFVSASDQNYNSTTGFWSIDTLLDGQSKTLTLTATVNVGNLNNSVFDLGVAKDYDLFVFKDVTVNSGDVEGKTAIGRDLTINAGYSFGDKLPAGDNGDVLIVGRNLTVNSSGGRVYYGNAVYGSSTNLPLQAFSIDGELRKDNVIDFAAAENYFVSLSATLNSKTANGTVTFDGQELALTGTDLGLNVFDVDGSNFADMSGLKIDVPDGSVVLVNISGSTINDWSGGLQIVGADPTNPDPYQSRNILYNFYEATKLYVNATSPKGTILAPYADLDNTGGFFNGQVIVKSITKALQFNHALFVGNIPGDKEILNVASLSSLDQVDPNNANNSSSAKITLTTQTTGNNTTSNGTWEVQSTVAPNEVVWTISEDISGNKIIGTWGGNIYKYVNGSYDLVNANMGVAYVWSIVKDDVGVLYAATEKGVYISNDNGLNWSLSSLQMDVRTLAIDPNGDIFAGTWANGLYKLENSIWTNIKIVAEGNQPAIHGLTFTSNGDMFVGSFDRGIYKLASGSNEFVKLDAGYEFIWTLHTAIDDIIFAGTYGGGVLMSYDYGQNWITRNDGLANKFIYAVNSINTDAYISTWAAGVFKLEIYGGVVLSKGNQNINGLDIDWKQFGLDGVSISSLYTDKDNFIYAGTREGDLYKFTPNLIGINDENEIPEKFELNQNYPNPFNPSTTIEFSIDDTGKYKLEVYNVLGQKVNTIINDNFEPGTYSINFDAGKYASGVYFYKLSGNDKQITRKMILIK